MRSVGPLCSSTASTRRRHDGIAAHRFDEIGEANYCKALALAEPRLRPLVTRRQAAAQEHLAIAAYAPMDG